MNKIKEPGADQPPSRRLKRYWRVAVLANIKDEKVSLPPGVPPDAYADFDHMKRYNIFAMPLKATAIKPLLSWPTKTSLSPCAISKP